MKPLSISMAWVVAKDFNQTKDFFTNTLGLNLASDMPECNWAEFNCQEGAYIGLAGESDCSPIKAGQNAVICINVENIEETKKELEEKGVHMEGTIHEVPGHVKLLLIQDQSGNYYHIVQVLNK